jgi:predicted TIM-barrel fold metal-dependent hydrolase
MLCSLQYPASSRVWSLRKMAEAIPDCLGPSPIISNPKWKLPAGSWDTHFHILGPQSRFPYSATRKYTPPSATLDQCFALHRTLGIDRGLVVHANTHGFENAVDMDAAQRSNGRYLAIIRLDQTATRGDCERLHAAGARGVRFAFNPQHGGTLDLKDFNHVRTCIKDLGWFVELHFEGAALPGLEDWLKSIKPTVVIDHFGRIDPRHGLEQRPFRILEDLAHRDNVWVKFSGADRISGIGAPYSDVVPFAHRLLEIAPDRIIWGSDWPHTGLFDTTRVPDDGKLVDALLDFAPDEALRRRILVDNPNRLIADRKP